VADLILETTFLIDLERELRRGKDGLANASWRTGPRIGCI